MMRIPTADDLHEIQTQIFLNLEAPFGSSYGSLQRLWVCPFQAASFHVCSSTYPPRGHGLSSKPIMPHCFHRGELLQRLTPRYTPRSANTWRWGPTADGSASFSCRCPQGHNQKLGTFILRRILVLIRILTL